MQGSYLAGRGTCCRLSLKGACAGEGHEERNQQWLGLEIDTVLGDERTNDVKKGRDTHEELWPWMINAGAGTPLRTVTMGNSCRASNI